MNILTPTFEDTMRYGRGYNRTASGRTADHSLCGSITRGLGYRNLAGRMAAISRNTLPYDYEVEYVHRSNNNACLWTNYTVNAENTVLISGKCVCLNSVSGRSMVLGCYDQRASYVEFQITKCIFGICGSGILASPVVVNDVVDFDLFLTPDTTTKITTLTIKSPISYEKSIYNNQSGFTLGRKYSFFSIAGSYIAPADVGIGRFKFYEDDILKHSYIPCVKDDVAAIYDEVTEAFLGAPTSGTLIAGPRV